MRTACFALLFAFSISAHAEAQHHKPEYKTAAGAMATLPFSEAVRVGDMLYISGAIGVKPGTMQLVEGGIVAETRQTMENIKVVVERHGSDMDNVVKCLVMMADMKEWGQMNDVYVTFFPKNKPARSALGASGLALNARVEIECTAVVKT
jgi:2-iminobutanoate/2-iminopropanoate deaminase